MTHPLEKKVWGVIQITMYRGVLVEKIIGGYFVLGKKVKTAMRVDEVINEAASDIENSLKR